MFVKKNSKKIKDFGEKSLGFWIEIHWIALKLVKTLENLQPMVFDS
jgi:hypothetical protein